MTLWTAVCLADDLPVGVVIPAECGDAEIAVWRSASGQVSAWTDRCPHRGMRLSHGFVRGETLNCIYHGWTYGTDGGCKRIPAHPSLVPPAVIRATAFAYVQAQGLVWVAPMATETAPPDLEDMLPVRSLVVEANATRLGELLPDFGPQHGPMWRGPLSDLPLGLLVQPLINDRTRVFVLVGDRTQAVAASRWIEGLRRLIVKGVMT
jgi:nitrite reductase/ring-hydroxylating ferredoxin subunit